MFWFSWKEHLFLEEKAFSKKFSPSCSEILSGLQPWKDSETWMPVVLPRFFSGVRYIYILLSIKILIFFWAQASSFVSLFFQEVTCNTDEWPTRKVRLESTMCHADSWINKHVVISDLKGGQSDSVWDLFGRGKLVCDRTLLSAKKPIVVKAWMMLKGKSKPKQDYTDLPSLWNWFDLYITKCRLLCFLCADFYVTTSLVIRGSSAGSWQHTTWNCLSFAKKICFLVGIDQ